MADQSANDKLLSEMLDIAIAELDRGGFEGWFERRDIPWPAATALVEAIGLETMMRAVADAATLEDVDLASTPAQAALVGFMVGWQFHAGRVAEEP